MEVTFNTLPFVANKHPLAFKADFFLIETINTVVKHITENELVKGLQQKDKTALSYLYDNYSAALYGIVYRILQSEELAEEILQDVFLKIWDKIETYDSSKGKLFTWMLNVARNQAIDKTRSKEISKNHKTKSIDAVVNKIDREEYIEQKVDGIGIKEILKKLPEEQRFIVEHLYFKGYSQSELAEEYNIPLGTVKTRLRTAMKQLRTLLGTK
jgi:RNA polymerase sigma factor (sigma-70 family)